jgi:hypothetical protein
MQLIAIYYDQQFFKFRNSDSLIWYYLTNMSNLEMWAKKDNG